MIRTAKLRNKKLLSICCYRLLLYCYSLVLQGNKACERRDLNPYAEALDPKSSVYANFTTLPEKK